MFESSLIDLETRRHSRPKWAPLPIAIALHGAVLVSVGIAQVWNVEALGEPQAVLSQYHVVSFPELSLTPAEEGQTQQTTPEKQRTITQPDTQELPDTPVLGPTTETTGPIVLNGPPTSGRDESWADIGPSNGPLVGPGPSDAPIPIVPVAAPPQDEILTVGGAVSRPVLLTGQPPRYTKVALRARIEGTVVLQAIINERGRVSDVRVLRGLPMGLDQAAVDTVQDWTFEPAKLGRRPVKVYYTLTVRFQLQG